DPYDLFAARHKDFAVPNLAGICFCLYGGSDLVEHVIGDYQFYLYLRHKRNFVFGAAIEFNMALLSTEPFNLCDSHSLYSDSIQGVFNLVKFERLDYRFYLLHIFLLEMVSVFSVNRGNLVLTPNTDTYNCLYVISPFAVLGFIEPCNLFLGVYPDACDCLENHEYYESRDRSICNSDAYGFKLNEELARISVKNALAGIIDGRIGKNTCKKRSKCAADCVDAEGIEGIVITQPGLEKSYCKIRNHTRRYTDDEG